MVQKRSIHFLVVEDEPEVADVICLFLGGNFSASFTMASSGTEAVEILKRGEQQFQMIISDFNMPNGNGSYVFEFAKNNLKQTPFILLTSDAWADHREFHNIEGVGYVSKPFIDDVLIKEIERLLDTSMAEVNVDHKFVGISLPTLSNIRTISHPLYVKLSEDKFVKILNANTVISSENILRYKEKGISYLYVEKDYFPEFIKNFRERVLNHMLFKGEAFKAYESLELSAGVHEVVLGAMKSFGLSKDTEELALKNIDMVRQMSEKFSELNAIFKWAEYSEQEYSFLHSVLICYLTTEVARHLKFDSLYSSEILSLAAYFHDLSLESHQVKNESRFLKAIYLQSKINKDDLIAVKNHVAVSAERLKQWLVCPRELYTVVCEHHEKPDGTGFPEGKNSEQIHELSACFIICEDLVQSYLELKDRSMVFRYFEDQKSLYSKEPFKQVHEFLLAKLGQTQNPLAS